MQVAPPPADPAHRRAVLRAVVVGALTLAAAGCGGDDRTSTTDPTGPTATTVGAVTTAGSSIDPSTDPSTGASTGASTGELPQGFDTGTVRITDAGGESCEVCVWLADTVDERGRGLMGVTDLGGAAGMLFVFDETVAVPFYMYETPMPLSIAWFDTAGAYVGQADMRPCLDLPADDCDRYFPGERYRLALETPEGALDGLGVGEGARLELLAAAAGTSCADLAATATATSTSFEPSDN